MGAEVNVIKGLKTMIEDETVDERREVLKAALERIEGVGAPNWIERDKRRLMKMRVEKLLPRDYSILQSDDAVELVRGKTRLLEALDREFE